MTFEPKPTPTVDDGHTHEWERGRHMAEAFGVPGNVMACALCGVEKRVFDNATGIAAAVKRRRDEEGTTHQLEATVRGVGVSTVTAGDAVDTLPEGSTVTSVKASAADRLAAMDAEAAIIAGGRVLVTMHYPLRMDVVSGIMRLVSRHYPNAVVGEDGTIREHR